jgi:hypothetical protein
MIVIRSGDLDHKGPKNIEFWPVSRCYGCHGWFDPKYMATKISCKWCETTRKVVIEAYKEADK